MGNAGQRIADTSEVESRDWRGSLLGLGTAVCFAISPVFIRAGLAGLPSPLLGVTIGMIVCVVAYGIALLLRRRQSVTPLAPIPRAALAVQIVAGVLVGLSTWARWIALDLAPVAVVIALGRLNVPLVLVLSPLMVGRRLERVTMRVWLGAGLIVAGSLVLIFFD
jgi:uncharacterized membrane protein